ncbi:MAG: DUF1893 domain-containing protein [Candidatus Aenigmatarchaeota archaeon]
MISDLELARRELKEKNLSLVISNSGKIIFESKSEGISDFLYAIEKYGEELKGSSIADSVVGKAVAMLCRYAKVSAVFASTISERGVEALKKGKIYFEFEKMVPTIMNKRKDDVCPFEKLVAGLEDEVECYQKIKEFLEGLNRSKGT